MEIPAIEIPAIEIPVIAFIISSILFALLYFLEWRKNRKFKKDKEQWLQNESTRVELEETRNILNNGIRELNDAQSRLAPLEAEEEAVIAVGSIFFDFDDSDKYKEAISTLKAEQKTLIREKRHIEGPVLIFEGDKKFHTKLVKLVLLAYSAAADDARHSVRWNNYERILKRFDKQRETINSLTPMQITKTFHDLKTREIIYTYHREELQQKEKEERRALQAKVREEARAEREIEQAKKQAERDTQIASKAVAETEAKLRLASEQERIGLEAQLQLLQSQLNEANAANTRVLSMAQQTKRGFVYIISNIGSFGEHVYKVGMTRRLVPRDRIKDLSDASVPFPFDIHAMIEADDAPAFESELHRLLSNTRVNRVNQRKEFFHVTLADIKSVVRQFAPDAEFIDFAEAREYRESQVMLQLERQPEHAEVRQ